MKDISIPIIQPKNQKKKVEDLLSDDQIQYIKSVLDRSCVDDACISKAALYEAIKLHIDLKIEQYQFESAITHAIRSGRITGFRTKTGRYGGICRVRPIASDSRSMSEIGDGIHLYKGGLPRVERAILIELYDKSYKQYIYTPKFKGKYDMNLKMACLGKHWSAVDDKYHETRVDYDSKPAPQMHSSIQNIAKRFAKESFPYHIPEWDICICNEYTDTSTLGIHRDNSESKEALTIGHPVVSFSLGASATFVYGNSRKSLEKVQLDDGDVLLFGGNSRLIYHGIIKIIPTETYSTRINFTLRKY